MENDKTPNSEWETGRLPEFDKHIPAEGVMPKAIRPSVGGKVKYTGTDSEAAVEARVGEFLAVD